MLESLESLAKVSWRGSGCHIYVQGHGKSRYDNVKLAVAVQHR